MSLVLPWLNAGLLIVVLLLATMAHRRMRVAEARWQRAVAEREALRLILEELGHTVLIAWRSDRDVDIKLTARSDEAVH